MKRNYFDTKFLLLFISILIVILFGCADKHQTATYSQKASYKSISSGYWHSIMITKNKTVLSWGANWYGQLGNKQTIKSNKPVKVIGLTNIISIDTGAAHNLALKDDGTVWAWGYNSYGQLGDGTCISRNEPVKVNGLPKIISIACGESHSLALDENGFVWAWGYNYKGQLGDGTLSDALSPRRIGELKKVKEIYASKSNSAALKDDGTLWIWGSNTNNQLCNNRIQQSSFPMKIKGINKIISLALGDTFGLALREDHTLWGWGSNGNGQLGTGDTQSYREPRKVKNIDKVISISSGNTYSLALKEDGTVWFWGGGMSSGDGTGNAYSDTKRIKKLNSVVSIDAGFDHCLVMEKDNSIWSWGSNWMGQLGDGTYNDSDIPRKCILDLRNNRNENMEERDKTFFYNNPKNAVSYDCIDIVDSEEVKLTKPEDDKFAEQWGLNNNGKVLNGQSCKTGIDINILPAWNITKGSKSVLVGILDTGIDFSHQDLINSEFVNKKEIPDNHIDDDGNGFIDDVSGWNFINNDNSVYESPDNDLHGTLVAGIISAGENGKGIVGIAPNIKLVSLKIIEDGNGSVSDAIRAIEYADKLGIKIINCSLGWKGSKYNEVISDFMKSKGMLFICSAGNKLSTESNYECYPACFDIPNKISVAGINYQGILDSDSNYGNKIDIAAPGTAILSTAPNNGYVYMGGSSLSAPFVTGVAALIKSCKEDISSNEIIAIIKKTAKHLPELTGKINCGGIVDAYASLKAILKKYGN